LRSGFRRIEHTTPLPLDAATRQNLDGQAFDLGIALAGERWSIDAVYEYTWTVTVGSSEKSDGFFGDDSTGQHQGGITATYRY
jgi:hypothetical protein